MTETEFNTILDSLGTEAEWEHPNEYRLVWDLYTDQLSGLQIGNAWRSKLFNYLGDAAFYRLDDHTTFPTLKCLNEEIQRLGVVRFSEYIFLHSGGRDAMKGCRKDLINLDDYAMHVSQALNWPWFEVNTFVELGPGWQDIIYFEAKA